jgi:histidinol-phosphatase (PHP family)
LPDHIPIEPLHHRGLPDYHCHCDFSIDAVGSIDDYCQAALLKGLVELCFTTHFDTNPAASRNENLIRIKGQDKPATIDNLAPYVDDVLAAGDRYYGMGLMVKLGVEIGWYPGCEELVSRLRERYQFDHVLCGIHEIDNICFCCQDRYRACFERFELGPMLEAYYGQAIQAANSGLFHAIAHLEYYRKYGEAFYGPSIATAADPFLPDLFAALISSDTALEINTSGLRRNMKGYFPSTPILTAAKRAGVEVTFLGSDAHQPEHVGFDFDTAVHLLSHDLTVCELD